MSVRALFLLCVVMLLTACVSTGSVNPLTTKQGRDEARRAYVQIGRAHV